MFEVEIRGSLPQDTTKQELLVTLSEKFGDYEYTRELVIFFRYDYDMRFKYIRNAGEFVLKKKLNNESNQAEWVTRVAKNDIPNFLFQLVHLGYKEGLLSTGERYIFKKDDMEFCLKYDTPIGNFFELEKLISDEKGVPEAENQLKNLLKGFNLSSWSEKEYAEVKAKSLVALKKIELLNKPKTGINKEILQFVFNETPREGLD
ncbi:hypothetical protein [Pedobacter sp.]|uniref:hypothetical protein n=1 Tax=Pedobacter sp. TaxID=1411316 RepID=UPI003C373544